MVNPVPCLGSHPGGKSQTLSRRMIRILAPLLVNFQEGTFAKSTTEDARSSVFQLPKAPEAAPALSATTSEAIACPVRVRFLVKIPALVQS